MTTFYHQNTRFKFLTAPTIPQPFSRYVFTRQTHTIAL